MAPGYTQKTYTRQATMTVEAMVEIAGPVVFGGDFNSWDAKAHYALIDTLAGRGLTSAYTATTASDETTKPTTPCSFSGTRDGVPHRPTVCAG